MKRIEQHLSNTTDTLWLSGPHWNNLATTPIEPSQSKDSKSRQEDEYGDGGEIFMDIQRASGLNNAAIIQVRVLAWTRKVGIGECVSSYPYVTRTTGYMVIFKIKAPNPPLWEWLPSGYIINILKHKRSHPIKTFYIFIFWEKPVWFRIEQNGIDYNSLYCHCRTQVVHCTDILFQLWKMLSINSRSKCNLNLN